MIRTQTKTASVAETAAEIARNIRAYGHWQGQSGASKRCCIVANPAWDGMGFARRDFIAALGEAAGETFDELLEDVYVWNDNTPTDQVLAVLDQMAGAA